MKRTFGVLLMAALILPACAPVAAPPLAPATSAALLPTDTPVLNDTVTTAPTPTLTATPMATATPKTSLKVTESTFLFPSPDTAGQGFPLPVGTSVYPIAKYGEFVQVETSLANGNRKGWIPITALGTAPTLVSLSENSVPWSNHTSDLEAHLTINPDVSFSVTENVIIVDNSKHTYYNDFVPYLLKPFSAFRLTFQIHTSDGQFGSIKLANKPNNTDPKIEWWKDIRRVDFVTYKGYLQIDLRDGRAENSATTIRLNIPDTKTITVTFLDAQGKTFSIVDETGRQIRQVDVTKSGLSLPGGLFPERMVYIGGVVSPNSMLTIRSLSLEAAPDGKFVKREPTLRQLADQTGISLGAEFSWWRMQDPRYYDSIFDNYNILILSEFGWKGFWRGRGDYDFESLDRIVDWAIRHGFRVRASHLVWGATEETSGVLPDWLVQGKFSRDEYIQILKEHVTTMVSHFKGRVTEWSIANEAISRIAWEGADFWMDKIGPEYIELSFRWACEADPHAILIFNDDSNESPRDQETRRIITKMYDAVKGLREKGVPIDVVGMQMHLLLKYSTQIPPKKQDVLDTMRKFGELGVKVYITEFDVDVHKVPGSQKERWEYQANLYRDMLEACLESKVCTSFATWGVSDSTSWITCEEKWCVKVPDADPLMFDKDFNPKPAYFAVRDVLLHYPKSP